MDAILSALSWLVDHKVVSMPLATAFVLGLGAAYLFLRHERKPGSEMAATGEQVQQTMLQDVRAEGDVTVRSDQRA